MHTCLISGIKIRYNEEDKNKLNNIINFINKYDFIFEDFSSDEVNIEIEINDFNRFLVLIIKLLLNENIIQNRSNFKELYSMLYLKLIYGNNINFDNKYSKEYIFFMFAIKYYNYDANKIANFLLYNREIDKEKVVKFIKDNYLFDIYNYLLSYLDNYVTKKEPYFIDNLDIIMDKIEISNKKYLKGKKDIKLLPKLLPNDFNDLFICFLNYINAPSSWYDKYLYLINNNLLDIIFSDKDSESFISNENKIIIETTGTIKYFISFVHEFMHYISNDDNKIFLREFPSIYFENIAAEFLVNIGYKKYIIDNVIKERRDNNISLYNERIDLLNNIKLYEEKGYISKEDLIRTVLKDVKELEEYRNKTIMLLQNLDLEVPKDLLEKKEVDLDSLSRKVCEENINILIENGNTILNDYEYLISSILVSSIINKDNITEMVINITDNLKEFSLESVMEYLEINPFMEGKKQSRKKNK